MVTGSTGRDQKDRLNMKQFFLTLTSGIVIVAVGYYFNLKSPNLRYQLSSPIEVDASATGRPRTVVQQIEIANTGNAVAQKVQIKIRKAVGTITLTKDSQSDKSEQFTLSPEGTELDYDSLRPAGRIKISLIGGDPLAELDVEIRDENGLGKAALTSESRIGNAIGNVIFWGLLILLLLLNVRELMKQWLSSKCQGSPIAALEGKKANTVLSREVGRMLTGGRRASGSLDGAWGDG
jgi:hypothetical protein